MKYIIAIIKVPAAAFPPVSVYLQDLPAPGPTESEDSLLRIEPQWLSVLRESHFVVDEDFDELSFVKFRYYQGLYAGDSLTLVVLPTLWCNFACPYCFEFKRRVFMAPVVEEALVRWVTSTFRRKRDVHVAWFGGEPLLAKRTIGRLTGRLQDFCQEIGASYSASLTTNGFYLDRSFASSLRSLAIRSVQVTLDGDQPDHDALRSQRDGSGSFARITDNIAGLCHQDPDCRLTLRVNCGDANFAGIPKLLRSIPAAVRERASVFFRWMWSNEASGHREFSAARRGGAPFDGLGELYLTAEALGWRTQNPHCRLDSSYCEVDCRDYYAISPNGDVFLCEHEFRGSGAIGSLMDPQVIRPESVGRITRWYALSPFEDGQCLACQLLPVCSGGCRRSRLEGRRECIEERSSLDLFVRTYVQQRMRSAVASAA